MKADLILISYNSKNDLERFLPSLKKNTPKDYAPLTIVDNNSDQETKDYLKTLEDIRVVFSEKNVGYGAACNLGAKETNSEFICFLNCDLLVDDDKWLRRLLKPLEDDPDVWVSGARMFNEKGEEFPTPLTGWVCGACVMVRRKDFEELGGFDENFFMFFEETDLFNRIGDKKKKVIRSEAKLTHFNPNFPPFKNKDLQKYWDESQSCYKKKWKIKEKVLIAVPCYRQLEPLFVESLIRLIDFVQRNEKYDVDFMFLYETVIYEVRENAVKEAMKRGCEYLLFIDNDAIFPPTALFQLLDDMEQEKADVVSGLFFKRVPPFDPTSLMKLVISGKNEENPEVTDVGFKPLEDWHEGLVEIDGCGMHFTLIRTSIFSKIDRPYFFVAPGVGEDLYFCFKAKVKGNAKMFCDTRVKIEHLGSIPIGENTYRHYKKIEEMEKINKISKLKFK